MTHPLITQLRFARSEFVRCLEGVSQEDAVKRLLPMNCISWIVGHLANRIGQQRMPIAIAPVDRQVRPVSVQFRRQCPEQNTVLRVDWADAVEQFVASGDFPQPLAGHVLAADVDQEARPDGGGADRDRPHVRPHQPLHEGHRQDGGDHGEGRQDQGAADLVHRLDGHFLERSAAVLRQPEVV